MKALDTVRRLLFVLPTAALVSTPTFAAESNPSPPSITGSSIVSNSQLRITWPAFTYPAAQEYRILSAPTVTGPYLQDLSGAFSNSVTGVGSWTVPLTSDARFHRLQTVALSSNDLLSSIVLNRLTFGPTPDEVERIRSTGPQAYIDEQMAAENISDTLNTDPPITNPPLPDPPQAPLTNWIRVSASGLVSGTRTNILLYLSGAGRVYVDDIRVVEGNVADGGPNLLSDGDFENDAYSPPWNALSPFNRSVITNSPTPDGMGASGTRCLMLLATAGGSGLTDSFWAPFATNAPDNQRYTLSFSYLPVQNPSNTILTVRLSGSQTIRTITLPPLPYVPPGPPTPPPSIAPTYAELTNTVASLEDLRAWTAYRAVHSPRQLHEVLVQFFENHFSTQYQKSKDWFDENFSNAITNETVRQYLAVDFEFRENTKWRQLLLNTNTTFYDLLKVSIESPAMVIYLDTVLNSKGAANENYARELLELHAFGADNGYIQQDIVDMAKVWTGWRVAKKNASVANDPFAPPVNNVTNDPGIWTLHFRTNNHSYAVKRLFTNSTIDVRFGPPYGGQSYSLIFSNSATLSNYIGTNGMGEGYRVIQHLADLPYTAEFISVKLCRTFVHENFEFGIYDYTAPDLSPEAQLIKQCLTAWDTPAGDGRKGNIRSVLGVIFNSALFRGHTASQQKIKTPLELTASAVRALRVVNTDSNGWVSATADTDGYGITGTNNNTSPLSRMGGMGLFNKAEPDGYSEFGLIWLNTANLCERMRFVQSLLMPTASPTLKNADYNASSTRNTSNPVGLIKLKLPEASWNDPATIVDYFLDILYPGEGKANLDLDRTAAINFLTTDDAGAPSPFSLASQDGRVRGMVALLMSFPRFQEQ